MLHHINKKVILFSVVALFTVLIFSIDAYKFVDKQLYLLRTPTCETLATPLAMTEGWRGEDILLLDDNNIQQLTDVGVTQRHLSWSPDGRYLAYMRWKGGGWDWFITDTESHQQISDVQIENDNSYWGWSPDSRYFAYFSAHENRTLYTYQIESQTTHLIEEVETHLDWAWSSDGESLFYEDEENVILSAADGSRWEVLLEGSEFKASSLFSPQGKYLTYRQNTALHIADSATLEILHSIPNGSFVYNLMPRERFIKFAAWTTDEKYFAFRLDQNIHILDMETGETLALEGDRFYEWHDDTMLYLHENRIYQQTIPHGEPQLIYLHKNRTPYRAVWSPSGEAILVLAYIGDELGEEIEIAVYHDGELRILDKMSFVQFDQIHWSPDGSQLVYVGRHERLHLYNFTESCLLVENGRNATWRR